MMNDTANQGFITSNAVLAKPPLPVVSVDGAPVSAGVVESEFADGVPVLPGVVEPTLSELSVGALDTTSLLVPAVAIDARGIECE